MSPPRFEKSSNASGNSAVALLVDKATAMSMMKMHMGIVSVPQTHPQTSQPSRGFKNQTRVQRGMVGKLKPQNSSSLSKKSSSSSALSNNDPIPLWNSFQLIGDSMMSRAATVLTGTKAKFCKEFGALSLGLSVHGQTSCQLNRLLSKRNCPKIHKNVILMIGTNDLNKNVPLTSTVEALPKVIGKFSEVTEKLVVLSVPPVLLYKDRKEHWCHLEAINQCLKEAVEMEAQLHSGEEKLRFVNLASVFGGGEKEVKDDLYESQYHNGRVDKVHWNKQGIMQLKKFLMEELNLADPDMDES